MIIRLLELENFRGIKNLKLNLSETTVVFGTNNTGKSTIMAAIQVALGRAFGRSSSNFSEYDYHLDLAGQPTDAPPIKITVTFSELEAGEWPDDKVQQLSKVVGLRADGIQEVTIRISSAYDENVDSFVTTTEFLDPTGNSYPHNTAALRKLQQVIPSFYLGALRDSAREFRQSAPFWGPFVKALKIDPAVRKQIEDDIAALNQQVLQAHTGFETIKDRLAATGKLVPLGGGTDPVKIEALPAKVFDILGKTQVLLSGSSGASLPLSQHGEGTQSLAVICLFDAFLEAQLIGEYGEHAVPILALEEPEAHLHPSAVRAVGKMLSEFEGQKLISTHSGDLLASVPLLSLRRLRRIGNETKVYSISSEVFTARELKRLEHQVSRHRGGLLFAKVWIIVEGETDELAVHEAARLMGVDLFGNGICCFETTIGYAPLIKLADQFGIHWIATADGDPQGNNYCATARGLLDGRPEGDHVQQVPAWDMENYLCHSGFGQLYIASLSPQKLASNPLPDPTDFTAYWRGVVKNQSNVDGKPAHILSVFESIEEAGPQAIPDYLRNLIELATAKSGEGD